MSFELKGSTGGGGRELIIQEKGKQMAELQGWTPYQVSSERANKIQQLNYGWVVGRARRVLALELELHDVCLRIQNKVGFRKAGQKLYHERHDDDLAMPVWDDRDESYELTREQPTEGHFPRSAMYNYFAL